MCGYKLLQNARRCHTLVPPCKLHVKETYLPRAAPVLCAWRPPSWQYEYPPLARLEQGRPGQGKAGFGRVHVMVGWIDRMACHRQTCFRCTLHPTAHMEKSSPLARFKLVADFCILLHRFITDGLSCSAFDIDRLMHGFACYTAMAAALCFRTTPPTSHPPSPSFPRRGAAYGNMLTCTVCGNPPYLVISGGLFIFLF